MSKFLDKIIMCCIFSWTLIIPISFIVDEYREPKFHFNDRVEVISGFYSGYKGKISRYYKLNYLPFFLEFCFLHNF